MHANKREELKEVYAGDIAAAVGLRDSTTGDTVCDVDQPIVLESIEFPEPVISIAIEPKTKQDQERLGTSLQKLATEDPSFRVETDTETGQTIIKGMGELHLEIIVDRPPARVQSRRQRRPPAGRVQGDHPARGEAGGQVHPADRRAAASTATSCCGSEPLPPGSGFQFADETKGGTVPREYIPAVEKGAKEALEGGVMAGYPMVDVKVALLDGSSHEVDSSEMAFKIAASMALKDAARKASPVLLEPVMAVEVVAPEEFMGEVIGNLSSRRGQIQATEARGTAQVIIGEGPAEGDVRLRDGLSARRRRAARPTRCSSLITNRCRR
jgi:elongation factor G